MGEVYMATAKMRGGAPAGIKRVLAVSLCVLYVLLCPICAQAQDAPSGGAQIAARERAAVDLLFAQTDSYMAVRVGDSRPLSFFLMHRNAIPFEGRTIERAMFPEDETIWFETTSLQPAQPCGRYHASSILCQPLFRVPSRFEFDSIKLLFTDGSTDRYGIGRIVIEVFDEEGSDALDTYVTTALGSDKTEFYARYLKETDDVLLTGLHLDVAASVSAPVIRETFFTYASGEHQDAFEVTVTFVDPKPVVYRFLLPRVAVTVNGTCQWVYPKVGCYCGGLPIQEEEMLEAYWAWQDGSPAER